jgi:hypothetical protein
VSQPLANLTRAGSDLDHDISRFDLGKLQDGPRHLTSNLPR